MTTIKKIIILYKKSTYKHYFMSGPLKRLRILDYKALADRFIDTHEEHYATLSTIEKFLKSERIPYEKVLRGRFKKLNSDEMLVTVGGDGTFLEGAQFVRHQMILGVNSDPRWSVGRFCYAKAETFHTLIQKALSGQAKIREMNRLELRLAKSKKTIYAVNDILICHRNPAAMSRYFITFGEKTEEQRSSGIWVATAAGSTGGIRSAGGKVLKDDSYELQFYVRELYCGKVGNPTIRTAIFSPQENLKVTSLMRDGLVFIDGSHLNLAFPFGEDAIIQSSGMPLKVIVG